MADASEVPSRLGLFGRAWRALMSPSARWSVLALLVTGIVIGAVGRSRPNRRRRAHYIDAPAYRRRPPGGRRLRRAPDRPLGGPITAALWLRAGSSGLLIQLNS
jgi:hypothetical protein